MNEAFITIFVILFPGIISALILENYLNHSPKWPAFKFLVHAFILGVTSYVILQLLVFALSLFPQKITLLPELTGTLDVWTFASERSGKIDISEVFAAMMFAPLVGALVTRLANERTWFGLRSLTKTSKYGNENLFSYFLAAKNLGYVYVRDYENDVMYEGVVASFSENDSIQELVLNDVRVFRSHDGELLEKLPSLYISKPAGEFIIEDAPDIEEMTNDG